MNKRYEAIWSNVTENDLKNIIAYIAADIPSEALRAFKKIKQTASNLYIFPERGRVVPELRDQGILHNHLPMAGHL